MKGYMDLAKANRDGEELTHLEMIALEAHYISRIAALNQVELIYMEFDEKLDYGQAESNSELIGILQSGLNTLYEKHNGIF